MCWNAEVSLNTFLSGTLLTSVIYILNPDDIFAIVFILSFIIMQLLEYFIWTNIKNKGKLRFYGFLTYFLIFLQPIMLLYFTKHYNYILLYTVLQLSLLIIWLIFINIEFTFLPYVAKNGHLAWNWSNSHIYITIFSIIYLIFYLSTIYIYTNPLIFILLVITFIYSLYNYLHYYTAASMWCWISNMLITVYFIIAIYKFDAKKNIFANYIYKLIKKKT
jgi:hypothetical protein